MTYPHPEPEPASQQAAGGTLWDEAMTDEPARFYGKVTFHLWKCVLVKGTGRVAYNPAMHAGEKTSVAIDISITPLDPTKKLIQRQTLDWVPEFKGVIRPSIGALEPQIAAIKGMQVGQFNPGDALNGMYVSGEFVLRPDNKPGETWTTFKFDRVYATREECQAEYDAWLAEIGVVANTGMAPPTTLPPTTNGKQRQVMAAFLPGLWAQAGGSAVITVGTFDEIKAKFLELIAANPATAAFFDENSPEVQAILSNVEQIPF